MFALRGWFGMVAAVAVAGPVAAQFRVTVEDATVQSRSAINGATFFTRTFNGTATGPHNSTTTNFTNGPTATYSAGTPTTNTFSVLSADVFGGASSSNYFRPDSTTTLTLSAAQHYFGIWWSGLNSDNTLTLKSGSTTLLTLTGDLLQANTPFTGAAGGDSGGTGHYGNPNVASGTSRNGGQAYAFYNIYFDSATSFDSIVFAGSKNFRE